MYELMNANKTATKGTDEYFRGSWWENEAGDRIDDTEVSEVGDGWIKTTSGQYHDVESWK